MKLLTTLNPTTVLRLCCVDIGAVNSNNTNSIEIDLRLSLAKSGLKEIFIALTFQSKTDEKTETEGLGYLLPAHEYFHQSMVVADCESELFRDGSRGLHGGAFFVATLLNRKEAKTARGKDNIDSLKDLILLKVDARFCHYYISRNNLDPEVDNTPDNVKESSVDEKVNFLHMQVAEVLRELLPYFKKCSLEDPLLHDHPLQEGRRPKYQPSRNTVRKEAA